MLTKPPPRDKDTTAALEAYLPRTLQRMVSGRPLSEIRAESKLSSSVALNTDIIGFSEIAESCSRLGERGAELLADTLDQYFGEMSKIVQAHGGDVVDYLGDGILAVWFVEKDGALEHEAQQALDCAAAMQARLLELRWPSDFSLRQRISIAHGNVASCIIGSKGKVNRFLVAGPAIFDVAMANSAAPNGGILITRSLARQLSAPPPGRETIDGHLLSTEVAAKTTPSALSNAPPVALSCDFWAFLPDPLVRHRENNARGRLAEFREVVTLFIRFTSLDFSNSEWFHRLETAVTELQTVVGYFEGSIERVSCDDKGFTALCGFGLPFHGHEDDASRAMLAALKIQHQLTAHGQECAIGLSYGRIFYADTGDENRRHMCMVGESVNRAARLMTVEKAGILCDQNCWEATSSKFTFDTKGPYLCKGWQAPVPAFMPKERRHELPWQHQRRLVGRAKERRAFKQKLDALLRNEGGLTVIRGEAGIGKSHLMSDCIRLARDRGVRIVTCSGSSVDSRTPYFPWRQLLCDLLTGCSAPDQAHLREAIKLVEFSEPGINEHLHLLSDILPMRLQPGKDTARVSGQARALALQFLVLQLVESAIEDRNTLLVFDDLHWFDEASTLLLEAFLTDAQNPHVLALITSRPAQQAANWTSTLLKTLENDTLELQELERGDMAEFTAVKTGADKVSDEVVDFIYQRTGGHALFSEELLGAMLSGGMLNVSSGECLLTPDNGAKKLQGLPRTVEGVIASRLDGCSPLTKELLRAASIIDRQFTIALAEVLTGGGRTFTDAIRESLAERFIVRVSEQPEPVFEFRHAIIRDVIYGQLPFSRRARLHRAMANHLSGIAAPHKNAAELAMHWECAEEYLQAIDSREQAATFAISRFSNREALEHVEHARRLTHEHALQLSAKRHAFWEQMTGDAHMELWEIEKAAQHYQSALQDTRWPTPDGTVGYVTGFIAQCGVQLAQRLGLLLPTAKQKLFRERRFAALIHIQMQAALTYSADIFRCLYHAMAALNLAERAQSPVPLAQSSATMGVILADFKPKCFGSFYERRAQALARESDDPALFGYVNLYSCLHWMSHSNWSASESAARSAIQAFEKSGADLRWFQAKAILYTPMVMLGDIKRARPHIRECIRMMPPRGLAAFVRSWPYAAELNIALASGNNDPQLTRTVDALGRDELMPRADRIRCLGLVALARWKAGQTQEAIEAADYAWREAEDCTLLGYWLGDGVAALAEFYLAMCDASEDGRRHFLKRAKQAVKMVSRYARLTSMHRPRARCLRGQWLRIAGRPRAARRELIAALQDARNRKLPVYEGRILLELALLGGANAEDFKHQATAIFHRLGTTAYLFDASVAQVSN